jgi:hypothetical protein
LCERRKAPSSSSATVGPHPGLTADLEVHKATALGASVALVTSRPAAGRLVAFDNDALQLRFHGPLEEQDEIAGALAIDGIRSITSMCESSAWQIDPILISIFLMLEPNRPNQAYMPGLHNTVDLDVAGV